MAIRGIDNQISIHKTPEASKLASEMEKRHDVFQRNLVEQSKTKTNMEQKQVLSPEKSHGLKISKDGGSKPGGNYRGSRKRKKNEGSKKTAKGDDDRLPKDKGSNIDIKI